MVLVKPGVLGKGTFQALIMCGLAGIFIGEPGTVRPEYTHCVRKMSGLQARRGPDDEGYWDDPEGRLYLGFRRLSILDTSPAGRQPMVSADRKSVLVFNGEIYNHPELKAQLASHGVRFRSGSDTEVLLEALNLWGTSIIKRLNGMFAFAWYSLAEKKLVLARDHAGIKPMYYFLPPGGKGIAFASQFNALLHTPWKGPGSVRTDVLKLYLHLHHVPAPYGLLENTHQLEPGHLLEMDASGLVQKRAWWSLPESPETKLKGREAFAALEDAVSSAVRRQRIADVPLGVFLSGGVDSPLVTAMVGAQSSSPPDAFTIGNPGWWQDESQRAAEFSELLNVRHHLKHIKPSEIQTVVDQVFMAQHEPLGDFSILPALYLSEFARSEITVALSGDGGDELFFGYERPLSLLRNGEDFRWSRALRWALYGWGKYGLGARRSTVIVSRSPGHYYYEVNGRIREPGLKKLAPDLNGIPPDFSLYDFHGYRGQAHLAHFSRRAEYYGQLQRCLKKLDMASMHHSLEVRVPLLDREVLDISLQMDPFENMRNGQRKSMLVDLLSKFIPREKFQREKLGFAVPLGDWLRGPLRSFVEDTLFGAELYPSGVFSRPQLRKYWEEHLSGTCDHKWGLWTILSLQGWKNTHLAGQTP